jgi:putative peptide zinc metalloprotease protein
VSNDQPPRDGPHGSTPSTNPSSFPPKLADGVELIGESAGSGYKKPPSLARRGDGQVVQLTRLLYLVAEAADGTRDEAAIAKHVSERFEKTVSADNVGTLVEDKLRPLGILAAADGSSPQMEKPDPLLALKFRKAIVPERVSMRVASLFKPLFFPPVVLAALVALVAFDFWLFFTHGVAQAFRQSAENPAMVVPVMALVVLAAGWHEFGHAAGCAYGGARPGAMGAGIYLVYPAFYTDVTDSYRLGRAGRLRTDLAGVYFNCLFILLIAGLYAITGWEALILIIVVSHVDAARQLLPFLRLDGYYIVADLTGVPDLFSKLKPILASSLPWRKTDPKVKELKLWARIVVTVWTLLVVPLLLAQLLMLLLHAPRIFGTAWVSLGDKTEGARKAFDGGDWLGVASGAFQSVLLILPMLGLVLTFLRLGGRAGRGMWRKTEGKPVGRLAAMGGTAAVVAALAYTWLPNGDYAPIRKGEKGTLSEGVAAIAEARAGRPSLVSQQRAADEGRLVVPPGERVPVTTTPSGTGSSPSTTAPGGTPATTVAPSRSTTTVAPTTTAPRATSTTVGRTTTTAGGG